ncbi:energy transducer TonB family protein [Variovorax sp. DAIF25]|uniref:energy transducer TonB family protein n=1 Tax=Variovorax sp. DAIF25 TaxID=3080983 RepID=UPI003D6A8380
MKPRDPTFAFVGRAAAGGGAPADAHTLWRRWGGWAIGTVLLALLAALVWYLLADTASQKRVVADAPTLMLPPPPPPPPEPEKLPEPEPEKIKPVTEPEPKPIEPLEPPKDDTPPSPNKDLGDPVTMDSAAQAGSDAFGIQAGSGGGMSGTGAGGGLGSGSFSRYAASVLQQALLRDPRTRNLGFDDIQIDIWLDAEGRTTRAQLVRGTGTTDIDEAVLAMVRGLERFDEKPPASLRFPMRVSMKGRRQ